MSKTVTHGQVLRPMPGIFPDFLAPIVRNAPDGVRELTRARWGMPGPPAFGGAPITNIRNVKSPHWRAWLKPENRCVVPFTSFCEYADTKPRKTPTWFALNDARPLAVFAGIWTVWHGTRGTKKKHPAPQARACQSASDETLPRGGIDA
jgi:putative SOS response-associated peptidase YedK